MNQKAFAENPVTMRIRLLSTFLLFGAFLLLLACKPPASVPWEVGGLTIQIINANPAVMAPGIDMIPASYFITGSGPNGASFSKNITNSSLTIPGLAFGTWMVQVDGLNASGTAVSHGESTATVSSGAAQTVGVSLLPVTGPGTLDLTVDWNPSSVNAPAVQAQLVPGQGAPLDLAFSIPSAGNAKYSNGTVENGYYTLVVKLLDNGQPVMGAVDVVRIVNAQTTTGTIDFAKVNTGTGSILVNITPAMSSPIQVSMGGQQAELGMGASTTVTASVPQGTGTVTYVWYLNGVSKGTGATFTFNTTGAPLSPGAYRLDVASFTSNGSRGGSATFAFKVFSTAQATLVWDPSPDPQVTGYKFYKGTASGVYGTPVDVGLVTTYTATGLLRSHTYYFAVTCYNSLKMESPYSNEVKYAVP